MLYWKQYRKLKRELDASQDRIEKLGSRDDSGRRNVEESEIRELRTTLARISKSQKLAEGVFQTTSDLTLRVQK